MFSNFSLGKYDQKDNLSSVILNYIYRRNLFFLLTIKKKKNPHQTGRHSICVLPFNARGVFDVISVNLMH